GRLTAKLTHRLGRGRHATPGPLGAGALVAATESTAITESTAQRSVQGEVAAAWVFGLGYGLSSLGCTLPVFLLVVGTAATASGTGRAALVLAAYAVGMAPVLLAVALGVAALGDVIRQTVVPWLRWVPPLAAVLLVAAGLYIVFFQVRAGLW